jgi:release factor glutamine methyltransferase
LPPTLRASPDTVAFLRAAGCVYAEEEAQILTDAATSAEELRAFLDRRATGEPLEYIVGWAEYRGLRIPLCTGVFVPRRRSEFLAACGVRAARAVTARVGRSRRVKVLDMCCGSGAIGLALAVQSGNVELLAADDSSIAVGCARENLVRVNGHVYHGDLFAALPQVELHSLDLIVANAPYVPTAEIRRLPAEARLYEPISTLDGGPDGTSVQRRILESAGEWLGSPGLIMLETSDDMADATAQIARDCGFTAEIRRCVQLDATVMVATQLG